MSRHRHFKSVGKKLNLSDGQKQIQWNLPIADMPWIADKMFSLKCDNLC